MLLTELMQERSAPKCGDGRGKWGDAPPVGYESGQTSMLEVQNDGGKFVEKVSSPMGFVEELVKEINSEFPGTEEVVIS